jgi:hypothetical protein
MAGRPEGKRPRVRPGSRWGYYNDREIRMEVVDWIHLIQDRER